MATYANLAGIRNYSGFTDRCSMAVASYAHYILASTPAGNSAQWYEKLVWAKNAAQNPGGVVSQLGGYILFDPVFANVTTTATFDALTDAQIDGAVQSAINSTLVNW